MRVLVNHHGLYSLACFFSRLSASLLTQEETCLADVVMLSKCRNSVAGVRPDRDCVRFCVTAAKNHPATAARQECSALHGSCRLLSDRLPAPRKCRTCP